MEEGNRELHFTYLDTVGRPVVVAHKTNLVEQHIQDFEVCAMKTAVNKTIVEIKCTDPLGLCDGIIISIIIKIIIFQHKQLEKNWKQGQFIEFMSPARSEINPIEALIFVGFFPIA